MALSDDELLNFDIRELGDVSRAPQDLLADHGDAYRQQLVIARHIEGWANRVQETKRSPTSDREQDRFNEGFVHGLLEVVAHLRQGDYLPGGTFYDQTSPRSGTD